MRPAQNSIKHLDCCVYVLSTSATLAAGAVVDAAIATNLATLPNAAASSSTTRSHAIPIQLSRAAEISYLSSSMPTGSAQTGDSRESARDTAVAAATHDASSPRATGGGEAARRRATSMAVDHASGGSRGGVTRSSSRVPIDGAHDDELDGGDRVVLPPAGVALEYHVETLVALEEIEGVALGVDSQSVTIETRRHRTFRRVTTGNGAIAASVADAAASTSGGELAQRQFIVETASSELGVCVAAAIQRAIRRHTQSRRRVKIGSGVSMYSIILHNWLTSVLNLSRTSSRDVGEISICKSCNERRLQPTVEIKQAALAYWLQCVPPPTAVHANADVLECYLFVRNFYPRAWRRKSDRWTQGYWVLRSHMLYQFTDSTCKVAIASINLKYVGKRLN